MEKGCIPMGVFVIAVVFPTKLWSGGSQSRSTEEREKVKQDEPRKKADPFVIVKSVVN